MPRKGEYEDLTGKRFSGTTVTSLSDRTDKRKSKFWNCMCDCGQTHVAEGSNLRRGHVKSCGCLKFSHEDFTDKTYGLLTAKSLDYEDDNGARFWKCLCKCGNYTSVRSTSLKNGNTKSCGCLKREDFSGQKINMLTCIEFKYFKNKMTYWLCKCDCGKEIITSIKSVKCGRTKSCGCFNKSYEDFTGRTYVYLFVESLDFIDDKGKRHWKCKCRCGNYVTVYSSGLKSGNTKSCGCLKIEKASGENSPNWNNKLTKEEREENKNRTLSPRYGKWHKRVLKRDWYTCQCCRIKNGSLQAHHVYSWHSHKKLRYITKNGVTLCKSCHQKFHKIYTNKFNNRKQFKEFIKNYGKNKTS